MAKLPASIVHASYSFWKSKAWDSNVIPRKLEWHEPDPFAPIPALVYEDAVKKLKAKQAALLEKLNSCEKPAAAPFSGVLIHDCSEYVPYGTSMLDNLRFLVNWGTAQHGVEQAVRYIAVGKGDLERYLTAIAAIDKAVYLTSGTTFKGIPVQEHDHRAGYYLLVCY